MGNNYTKQWEQILKDSNMQVKRKPGWLKKLQPSHSVSITIGRTVYSDIFEEMTDARKFFLLVHESVHVEQQAKWTLPLYAFLYTFVLPFGLSYFRFKWELEAYATEAMAHWWRGHRGIAIRTANDFSELISSRTYFWGWLFKNHARKVFLEELEIRGADLQYLTLENRE